jgi:hypothetical protein
MVGASSLLTVSRVTRASAGSRGALLSGNSRLAFSSVGPRMRSSVITLNVASRATAHARMAVKAGSSRSRLANMSERYFTSMNALVRLL